jgi:hypothetical protein
MFTTIQVRNPILTQFERDRLEDRLTMWACAYICAFGVPFVAVSSLMIVLGKAAI